MNNISGLIFLSIIIEGLITYVKEIYTDKNVKWAMVASIIIGVVISVGYNIDLMSYVGLTSPIPYFGSVLTGIVISRGSNYIYEVYDTIKTLFNK